MLDLWSGRCLHPRPLGGLEVDVEVEVQGPHQCWLSSIVVLMSTDSNSASIPFWPLQSLPLTWPRVFLCSLDRSIVSRDLRRY